MRETFLPFSPPFIGEEEIAEVVDSLRSGWITTGPKVKRFQEAFATYLGAPQALALSSCTAALHTALSVLGIGRGDEVVTTTMTFCSTVSAIEQVGARPVLVDVEADTLNLDPAAVAAAVSEHTRAILPVHYGGHPADLDPLTALAEEHDLAVVEDAAHALPARYRGRLIGAGQNPVAFSFYATKNLTTAEGGMLTGAADFLSEAEIVSLHGMNRDAWRRYAKGGSWYYEIVKPGFKYNMSDLQAAIGIAQLDRLEAMQARRHEVVLEYNTAFAAEEAIALPVERPEVQSAWHLYPIRLREGLLSIDRDRFITELAEQNIGTSVHFIPVHLHPYFRERYGFVPEDFPVALKAYQQLVSLPLNPTLTPTDVQDVITAVLELCQRFRR